MARKAWALPEFCRIESGGGSMPVMWRPCLPKIGRGGSVVSKYLEKRQGSLLFLKNLLHSYNLEISCNSITYKLAPKAVSLMI
jgi:hypothetical protein